LGALPKENLRGLGGQKSPVAKEAIDRIAVVYAIEAKAQFAPVDERVRHRADHICRNTIYMSWQAMRRAGWINRRFTIVPPAMPSTGHAETLD
jgi:hypothetical protein